MSQSIIALQLGNIAIRQANGMFSLNDLHKAAGGETKHEPGQWLRNEQTKALVAEIETAGAKAFEAKPKVGTYACRELVIAYAAWISAAFHLKVIRVFLAAVQPQAAPTLDYTRISPYSVQPGDALPKAEADELRAMLETAAQKLPKEKRGTFLQSGWAKLKKHTGVNYRKIPKAAVTDALSLLARHVAEWELVDDAPPAGTVNELVAEWVKKIEAPNGYPATLFEPIVEAVQRKTGKQPTQPDTSRMQAAFDAAAQAAAAVQKTVFNSVLAGNDEWKFGRWMLAFIDDSAKGSPAYVRQMDRESFVATWPRLVRDVANGEAMCTSEELIQMASACIGRLEKRGKGPSRLAA